MSPETIAAAVAAVIAIAAGVRKARELSRDDGAVSSVVEMLRQEVSRLSETNARLINERDHWLKQSMELRQAVEAKDRERHNCQLQLNQLLLEKENGSN